MIKVGCGHNKHGTAYFRPQDHKFILQGTLPNEDPEKDFPKIMQRFLKEYEKIKKRLDKGDRNLGTIVAFNRMYEVLNHIDLNEDDD